MLTKLALLAAGSKTLTIAFPGSAQLANAEPASAAATLTYVKTVMAALGVVSSLSDRGSSLPDILAAQQQTLDLVVDQLVDVQRSLFALNGQIQKLSEERIADLGFNFGRELSHSIMGAAANYEGVLDGWKISGGEFATEFRIQSSRAILTELRALTRTLEQSDEWRAIETAFLIPIAASVESSLSLRLGADIGDFTSVLNFYSSWCDKVLETGSHSLRLYRQSAIFKHEQYIAAYLEAKDAHFSEIDEFSLTGGQNRIDHELCLVSGNYLDAPSRGVFSPAQRTFVEASQSRLYYISSELDPELGVRLVKLEEANPLVGRSRVVGRRLESWGVFPNYETECTFLPYVGITEFENKTAAREKILKSKQFESALPNLLNTEITIARINLERAKLALWARARITLLKFKKELEATRDRI